MGLLTPPHRLYPLPVRQASNLPAASFRFRLATDTLAVQLICIDPSSNPIIISQIILQCVGSRTDGMPTVDQSDMRGLVTA